MGYSKWSSDAFDTLTESRSTKSKDEIFTSRSLDTELTPKGIEFRESRDSDAHPTSVPVIVQLDVTGSMGSVPDKLVRGGKLSALMNTMIKHGTAHPQIMFGAIGDHKSDAAPLQISQFESGNDELDTWLTKIFLEGNGGPWGQESYLLAWLFAARHTSLDSFEKRGEKGFLFTIGDERTYMNLSADEVAKIMGGQGEDVTAEQLLEETKRMYHVYHIHLNHDGKNSSDSSVKGVINDWRNLLGQNLIVLNDYELVAETIATQVAITNGADRKDVLSSFDAITAGKVGTALAKTSTVLSKGKKKGVVAL